MIATQRSETVSLWILGLVVALLTTSCTVRLRESQFFFPHRYPVISDNVHRENVEIPVAAGVTLRGWLLTGTGSSRRPFLIYSYGGAQTVLESAVELHSLVERLQVNLLAIDYRGYGFSDGTPTFVAIQKDGLAVYDFLTSRSDAASEVVFVAGRSMGTIPALEVAAKRQIRGVFLVSPFTNTAEVISNWQSALPWYKKTFVRLRAAESGESWTQPVELIRQIDAPVLIIHGTEDTTFPPSMGRRMFDEAATTHKHWLAVEGRGHEDLPITEGTASDAIQEFIALYGHANRWVGAG